jgi:hypothetical protein
MNFSLGGIMDGVFDTLPDLDPPLPPLPGLGDLINPGIDLRPPSFPGGLGDLINPDIDLHPPSFPGALGDLINPDARNPSAPGDILGGVFGSLIRR